MRYSGGSVSPRILHWEYDWEGRDDSANIQISPPIKYYMNGEFAGTGTEGIQRILLQMSESTGGRYVFELHPRAPSSFAPEQSLTTDCDIPAILTYNRGDLWKIIKESGHTLVLQGAFDANKHFDPEARKMEIRAWFHDLETRGRKGAAQ